MKHIDWAALAFFGFIALLAISDWKDKDRCFEAAKAKIELKSCKQ